MTKILIVEDNAKIRANFQFQLEDEGYEVTCLGYAEQAESHMLEGNIPDLLLLDVRLPGQSGVDLVRHLSARSQLPPTIIISGEASLGETEDVLGMGVYDYLEKPVTKERLLQSVKNCIQVTNLKKRLRELQAVMPTGAHILGVSTAISKLRQQIQQVAPTQGRVLILGESGTGKELVAAALHELSTRRDQPFIKINCAAIPAHLIEDELFGHVKGAYTDARHDKKGLFEQANKGTLFLDEIGDMAIQLQARLLRVLEDGTVRRVGGTTDRQVDVRVIAATHCDLEEKVREGSFRQDLYFRLSAVPLHLPPLRSRLEDIPLLFSHFIKQSCLLNRLPLKQVEEPVFKKLQNMSWPGNVRELKNMAERMVIFGGDPISSDQLPPSITPSTPQFAGGLLRVERLTPPMSLKTFKHQSEKEFLEVVLQHTNWNVSAAAKILDIQRPFLHQKMKSLGIRRP